MLDLYMDFLISFYWQRRDYIVLHEASCSDAERLDLRLVISLFHYTVIFLLFILFYKDGVRCHFTTVFFPLWM